MPWPGARRPSKAAVVLGLDVAAGVARVRAYELAAVSLGLLMSSPQTMMPSVSYGALVEDLSATSGTVSESAFHAESDWRNFRVGCPFFRWQRERLRNRGLPLILVLTSESSSGPRLSS